MHIVFLHGGPGFNGAAERIALAPLLASRGYSFQCSDEPSRLRPDGDLFVQECAYERWLAWAERCLLRAPAVGRVVVAAHSFAVHAAFELARRHASRVHGLVAIAPAADPVATFRSVLALALADFAASSDERADQLSAHLQASTLLLDEPMRQGFALAAHAPGLWDRYWVDTQAQTAAALAKVAPEFVFDADSFFSVLADFRDRHAALHTPGRVRQPVLALFGDQDVVTPRNAHESALRAMATTVESMTLEDVGHYVHLEAPGRFLEAVESWLDRQPRRVHGEVTGT